MSWISFLFYVFVCTLCLAAGLYYIAEVVEEYTLLAAKVIRYAVFITTLVFIGMYTFESLPLHMTALGLIMNLDYLIVLSSFPTITLSSLSFILGAILVLVNHYFAFQFFSIVYYPFPEVLAYFTVCLWLVPFAFFVSLSINEHTLPNMYNKNQSSSLDNVFRRPRRAGILGIFDYLTEKKDYWKEEVFGGHKMF